MYIKYQTIQAEPEKLPEAEGTVCRFRQWGICIAEIVYTNGGWSKGDKRGYLRCEPADCFVSPSFRKSGLLGEGDIAEQRGEHLGEHRKLKGL